MASREWALAGVLDVIAAAVPERDMVVWESRRLTYGDAARRAGGLAAFLGERGIGLHRERDELERWESGQDAVALVLRNAPEYLESMYGCFRARAVPFNVNHHYKAGEVAGLFAMIGPAAVVYHRSLGPLVADALSDRPVVLVDVDDGSGVPALPGSTAYADAVAHPVADPLPAPSPDDLYMICTGGTTGTPKAVLWRQADIFVSAMGGTEDATAESIAAEAGANETAWFAAPPLMHGAAQWTAFGGLRRGATIVLHDELTSSAAAILRTAERERVSLLSIVGDAFARPLVDELGRGDYDLGSLRILATGGAATNEQYKQALFELLPDVIIVDGYGASETGGMAFAPRTRRDAPRPFTPAEGAAVVSADRSRFLDPGEDELGWIARRGRVPLGYLGDRDKTEETFPVVAGERVSVPGDRGRLDATGSIVMLGRDSLVVNTGGEKVFVEEVEEVLRRHPGIADALVVGRPSERFGQEVVAIVQPAAGAELTPVEVRELVADSLARFKAPRAVAFCDQVPRHPNGKADYGTARSLAEAAVDATVDREAAETERSSEEREPDAEGQPPD